MTTPPSPPAGAARARLGALTNTLLVAGGYLLSRVLGLAREVIIAGQFGTSAQLDAFRATFSIIDIIYLVIAGGALGTAYIPVFAGMLAERRADDAWRLAGAITRIALAGLVAACLLIGLLAEPIVALTVGSGFDAPTRELTVWLLRLMLVQPILLGLGGIAKSTLEAFDQFTLPALAANIYNLGIIGGALLAPWLGVAGLAVGVNVGALLFLAVQLPGLRAVGARALPGRWAATEGVAQIGRLIGPRLFGQGVWQINLLAVTSFASLAGPGAVAANGLAFQLMLLPHGLLALSAGTVIFPQLARLHAAGEQAQLRAQALQTVRLVLFVALPASALLGALALPALRLLFERGRFDADSTALALPALQLYALGLAGFSAAEILVRTFYAMQDTRTPVAIAALAVAFNLALGYALLRQGAGLAGLALAFSLANTLEAALLLAALGRRLGGLPGSLWGGLARMLLASLAALGAAQGALALLGGLAPAAAGGAYRWPGDFPALALVTGAAALAGAAAYAALALALRLPEVGALLRRLRRRPAVGQ